MTCAVLIAFAVVEAVAAVMCLAVIIARKNAEIEALKLMNRNRETTIAEQRRELATLRALHDRSGMARISRSWPFGGR